MEVEASLVYRAYLSWGWVKISSEFHLSDEEKYLGGQEELVFNLNLGGGSRIDSEQIQKVGWMYGYKEKQKSGLGWWCTSVVPELGKLR